MELSFFEAAYTKAQSLGATHINAVTGGSLEFTKGDDVPLVVVDCLGKLTVPDPACPPVFDAPAPAL